jgi:hypothetical protein
LFTSMDLAHVHRASARASILARNFSRRKTHPSAHVPHGVDGRFRMVTVVIHPDFAQAPHCERTDARHDRALLHPLGDVGQQIVLVGVPLLAIQSLFPLPLCCLG